MYVNKYYLLEGKIEVKETISLIANNLDEYKLGEWIDEKGIIDWW